MCSVPLLTCGGHEEALNATLLIQFQGRNYVKGSFQLYIGLGVALFRCKIKVLGQMMQYGISTVGLIAGLLNPFGSWQLPFHGFSYVATTFLFSLYHHHRHCHFLMFHGFAYV